MYIYNKFWIILVPYRKFINKPSSLSSKPYMISSQECPDFSDPSNMLNLYPCKGQTISLLKFTNPSDNEAPACGQVDLNADIPKTFRIKQIFKLLMLTVKGLFSNRFSKAFSLESNSLICLIKLGNINYRQWFMQIAVFRLIFVG